MTHCPPSPSEQQSHFSIEQERDLQTAISKVLRLSLQDLSLEKLASECLHIILDIPWLSVLQKGSIFITDKSSPNHLLMIAEKDLPESLLTQCKKLPFGVCLCGQAAETKSIVFANCIDHRHDISFEGMTPHGHICVPIKIEQEILGVINLYITHGHKKSEHELRFLSSIADALAGVIKRRKIEEKLNQLGRILDSSLNEIYVFESISYKFIQVNEGAQKNLGYTMQELIHMTPIDIKPAFSHKDFTDKIKILKNKEEDQLVFETTHQRKNGSTYPVEVRLQYSETSYPSVFVAIIVDISERKEAEQKLSFMAHHDPLTQLPNRLMFNKQMDHCIAHSLRYNHQFGLMFLDLDHFKKVNDQFGHDAGDHVLCTTAKRIQQHLRKSDTFSRLGGDEFTLLLPEIKHKKDLKTIAKKLIKTISKPIEFKGNICQIGVSIGIGLFPKHGKDTDTLLKEIDQALYHVKKSGRNGYAFVD
ncbi:diguanylate cyclase domain-containing protein [Magnetococcales bacterium HHB-1]